MLMPSIFGDNLFDDFMDDPANQDFSMDNGLVENGCLTISAAKGVDKDEQEKKTGKYIRRERFAGACERSFYVGEELTHEDIKGEFKHGILRLTIPKKVEKPEVPEKKFISIEG